jgi:predicted DNA-binding transcriptional regulator
MSISLMTAVWKMTIPCTDKMVLLALADAANDAGITWLAVSSKRDDKQDLIKKTSLSERAVQMAIKRLCEQGFLARDERLGRGVIYTVTPPHQMHPRTTCTPAPDAPTPARRAPKPSTNRQSKSISMAFPISWEPSPEDLAYATSKGLTPKETDRAREDFRGHFIANGKKTSTDWSLNWQRWCRVAADDKLKRAGQATHAKTGRNGSKPSDMAEIVRRRAEARGEIDVSSDGWLSTGTDGVFVRGADGGAAAPHSGNGFRRNDTGEPW